MKTVSGVVLSSKPLSLSKAARNLSRFVVRDNGASPAYVHYLKRVSESFDELVQLHKETKVSGSKRKSKKNRSSICDESANSVRDYGEVEEAGAERFELDLDDRRDEVKEPKKKKKKKKGGESEGKTNGVEQKNTQGISETIDNGLESKRRKKEGKKGKKDLIEDGRSNGDVGISKESADVVNGVKSEEIERKKKKKMSNGSEEIAELREGEREKKVSKKRKSEEMGNDSVEVDDSAEKKMHNKKRKKVKNEGQE